MPTATAWVSYLSPGPSPGRTVCSCAHLALGDILRSAQGVEAPAGGDVHEGTEGQEGKGVGAAIKDDELAAIVVTLPAVWMHTLAGGSADVDSFDAAAGRGGGGGGCEAHVRNMVQYAAACTAMVSAGSILWHGRHHMSSCAAAHISARQFNSPIAKLEALVKDAGGQLSVEC